MRIKSKFSPIVVIRFLIFSMSMAASVNVHAANESHQCKQYMAVNRMIDDLMSLNKDIRKKASRMVWSWSLDIDNKAKDMKQALVWVERDTCGKSKPSRPPGRDAHGGGHLSW
jgi:hypothetical protein